MILYGQQSINQQDIDSVVAVLTSDYLTQGPQVPAFEAALSAFTGVQYTLAVNSATSALHIACLALGVGVGDRVWTSPITFVASANAALYCGAEIDFVDIDAITGNMCPTQLAIKLAEAAKQDKLPKVIIPVHLCGHSCDMQAIGKLASQYGIKVIEDASHAIGGYYQSEPVGNCRYSDICIFSFHPVKIITTAEGGAALTNSSELAAAMARLRSHGITKLEAELQRQDQGDWYYEQHDLGYNYRMTELQAALGLSQMTRLQSFVCRRNELATHYTQLLTRLPLTLIQPLAESISSYHLFVVRLPKAEQRRRIFDEMRALNVQVHVHYIPVHLQPYYQNLGFTRGQFPQAETFYNDILTLPLHPGLSQKELAYVVDCLEKVI
ncbi:UDP-4-amino-4,6-dideoxy-N-acetyl-beta-L-altrosami ne transaminase [Shewanella sairae]|uniref:UDP-4-amino-4, 6-dideoxy-N-acetyl-beta-L-altrosami ne transaminase n=1 Tax=Shewanella sairae TaxID=190310 RepID=A0ABQ4PQA5_9GAMM|nr:UDP-4-amino-4,6-dideoxy-N-acetyl-beta-L-altrosamine transaminase [Shewanella sairae]MCL1129279.1 UDP-4-amino-4,6-dideoxy-N-acetyl-beta-L-altrosamine transaminase [Shewanella sairae]GIU51248.1 UDP-4-amino-4,6-dideoxy-N-acetyl-beta-L-altrosami ne transaminase [Shewanella sairae]